MIRNLEDEIQRLRKQVEEGLLLLLLFHIFQFKLYILIRRWW
jgi:hypothetical protein